MCLTLHVELCMHALSHTFGLIEDGSADVVPTLGLNV